MADDHLHPPAAMRRSSRFRRRCHLNRMVARAIMWNREAFATSSPLLVCRVSLWSVHTTPTGIRAPAEGIEGIFAFSVYFCTASSRYKYKLNYMNIYRFPAKSRVMNVYGDIWKWAITSVKYQVIWRRDVGRRKCDGNVEKCLLWCVLRIRWRSTFAGVSYNG